MHAQVWEYTARGFGTSCTFTFGMDVTENIQHLR